MVAMAIGRDANGARIRAELSFGEGFEASAAIAVEVAVRLAAEPRWVRGAPWATVRHRLAAACGARVVGPTPVAARRVGWGHMNGAEVLVRRLADAGVGWVFGIPSGPVLPLIEALRRSDVRFVLTTNETSAGFMAATVGPPTGVRGVCVATVGPGATNLTTGVGAAWLTARL